MADREHEISDAKKKENKEYEEMMQFMDLDEMGNKYLKRQFVDPSSALILV